MGETIIKRCTKCGDIGRFSPNFIKCLKCGEDTLLSTSMTDEEFCILCRVVPKNNEFCSLMIDLKEKDPIEYQLKMSQFKTQVNQHKQQQEGSIPKCPTCSSTNIQKIGTGERVTSVAMLGIFSKKINKSFKCKNCGYTW